MIWARGLKLQVASYQTRAPARQAGRGQFVSSICASGIGGIAYDKTCLRLVTAAYLLSQGTHTWRLHGDTHVETTAWPRGGWYGSERSVPCQLVWQERSLIASQLHLESSAPVGLPNRSQSLLACGNTRSIVQTNHLETGRNCGSRHTMSRWHPSGLYGDTQLVNSRGAAFSQAPQRQRSSRS